MIVPPETSIHPQPLARDEAEPASASNPPLAARPVPDASPPFCIRPATRRERRIALALLVVITVACTLVALRNPATVEMLPSCPVKQLSGLECPGCGSTRAVHHLLNLRWHDAWRHNIALIVIGLPFAALLFTDLALTILSRRRLLFAPAGPFGLVLSLVILAWAVARNLPFDGFELLRPP